MSGDILGNFEAGNSISQTANRTAYRGTRRLLERFILRRERLHKVLNIMGFLPSHYAEYIDKYGKFINYSEPKLAWRKNSNNEYEFLFKDSFNEMLNDFQNIEQKVPYDWTIYYLRKKALTNALTKEELAWVLLNFNQKRGYYQLRDEEEDATTDKKVEFYSLKVKDVEEREDEKKGEKWYDIYLENGFKYSRTSTIPLDWVGKTLELIVTTALENDGTPKRDKDGEVKRSLRMPKEDDWTLIKKKTEFDLEQSNKTVGEYIYNSLCYNPEYKIKGKLIKTIERKYYKEELQLILEKQKEFHPELIDTELYLRCIKALYPKNEGYKNSIANSNFTYLFLNDIIFYQRPLKSKKSTISDCPYEEYSYKDKEEKDQIVPLKCIAKSHPLFQEFRLWQFIKNAEFNLQMQQNSD